MQQVITPEQSREITHGRGVFAFEHYDAACRELQEAITFVRVKDFIDKAEAIATVGRARGDSEAVRLAKQLAYEAAARLHVLAEKERPTGKRSARSAPMGWNGKSIRPIRPGAKSWLRENGLTVKEAYGSARLARMSAEERAALAALPRPPSLGGVGSASRGPCAISNAASRMRKSDPEDDAAELRFTYLEKSIESAVFIKEWVERYLVVARARLREGK